MYVPNVPCMLLLYLYTVSFICIKFNCQFIVLNDWLVG